MRHLIIKDIGPINNIDIELDKLNVFIGPQSAGKSTITKIACYCSWFEKRVSVLGETFNLLDEEGAFADELVRFHKLEGYLFDKSYIYYETDILSIEYIHSNMRPTIEWKNRFDYKKGKISYIPAERNIVASVPNWISVKLKDNNILSFISDWAEARTYYKGDKPLSIVNLGVKYFFDNDNDKVIINEKNESLELTNTSSGLQSLIPQLVVLDYVFNEIYEIKSLKRSIQGINETNISIKNLYNEIFRDTDINDLLNRIDTLKIDLSSKKTLSDLNKDFAKTILKFNELTKNFDSVHFTNVYLEEPEQNLFPMAQQELVRELVRYIGMNRNHSLTITTHSPYILSSINNLLYANQIGLQDEKGAKAIIEKKYWIDYNNVRAYFVDGGTVRSILDDSLQMIEAEEIDGVSDVINREYEQLLETDK